MLPRLCHSLALAHPREILSATQQLPSCYPEATEAAAVTTASVTDRTLNSNHHCPLQAGGQMEVRLSRLFISLLSLCHR